MLTEREEVLHSWLIEDISLRWGLAAESFERAVAAYETAAESAPAERRDDLALWADDLRVMARQARNYWRHTQETLLARTMRAALQTGAGLKPEWIERMRSLLAEDVAAQRPHLDERGRAAAGEIVAAFARDPQAWLKTWLQDRQTDVFAPPRN
jgi:hypothetical protein